MKRDDPKIMATLIREKSLGRTTRAAARAAGISRNTAAPILRDPDVRKMIADQSRRLIGLLPGAVDLVADTMAESTTAGVRHEEYQKEKNLLLLRKLALSDGAAAIMRAAGLLPTQSTAPTIQALVVTDQAGLSPAISQILGTFLAGMDGSPISRAPLDVTPDQDD